MSESRFAAHRFKEVDIFYSKFESHQSHFVCVIVSCQVDVIFYDTYLIPNPCLCIWFCIVLVAVLNVLFSINLNMFFFHILMFCSPPTHPSLTPLLKNLLIGVHVCYDNEPLHVMNNVIMVGGGGGDVCVWERVMWVLSVVIMSIPVQIFSSNWQAFSDLAKKTP